MSSLAGKTVVVIGGSRGVGRQIVEAAGARVVAVERQAGALEQLRKDVPSVDVLALSFP